MSGAEAIVVLGIMSSAITIIEASRQVYDAAKDAQGLHEAFKKVSETIPLVLDTLRDAKHVQLRAITEFEASTDPVERDAMEESAKAIKPVMTTCEENRYWKAVQTVTPGKKRRVEELMKEILEKLQVLHMNRFFKDSTKSQKLNEALEDVDHVLPSLPDKDGRYGHFGSGSLNVNSGKGTQRNYTQSGGSGRMFSAETQHFGNVAQ